MIAFLRTVIYVPLYNILIFFTWLMPGNSIGLAIVLLTILIRVILLPNSFKAAKAQARLQMLQPEMNRIRREITDQKEQGQALMELYKKEGVSPFGSCLPLLIQLPVLIILYQVLRAGINVANFSMLYSFVPHPESINAHFLWVDLTKPDLWIFPILAGLTQFVLSKMMTPPTPKTAPGEQMDPSVMINKQMVYLFPVMTVFIARSIPSALSLYWIVTTVFGIVQQVFVNRMIKNNPKEKAEALEDAREIEAEYSPIKNQPDTAKEEKEKKTSDMMSKLMNKRLEKMEKKTGVEISIRKKK